MSKYSVKKHWIIFRELDTRIKIYVNLLSGKDKKEIKHYFKQDLDKNRPYLIIEESKEKLFILTLTKSKEDKEQKEKGENPSFGRFGPIKCPCLSIDTYVILHTKIFMNWSFAKKYHLDMVTKNNNIEHKCLSEIKYSELMEALEVYWNKYNERLTLIELGANES